MIHNGISPFALGHDTLRPFEIVLHGPIYIDFQTIDNESNNDVWMTDDEGYY